MKFFNYGCLLLMVAMMSWIVTDKVTEDARFQIYNNAQARAEREYEVVVATRAAQEYADPIVRLSEQLVRENAMFTDVIDRARSIVTNKTIELDQMTAALNDAVELLQVQITENNRCVDQIRQLERLVAQLLEKIPEGERPSYIPDGGFDPVYTRRQGDNSQ